VCGRSDRIDRRRAADVETRNGLSANVEASEDGRRKMAVLSGH